MFTGKFSRLDHLLAWGFGLAVAVFAWFSCHAASIFPAPELWEDVAVAAGIRPARELFPLLWHMLVSLSIRQWGLNGTLTALNVLGPVSLGAVSVFLFYFLGLFLPEKLVAWLRTNRRGRLFLRVFLLLGVALFVFSDPVWLACRVFSPAVLRLLTFFLLLRAAIGTARTFTGWKVVCTGILTALVAAESAVGFVVFLFYVIYLALNTMPEDEGTDNFFSRFFCARRYMTAFFFSYVVFISVNLVFYYHHTYFDQPPDIPILVFRYLLRYLQLLAASGPFLSGGFLFLLVFTGLICTFVTRFQALALQSVLPARTVFAFALAGVVAAFQSLPLPTLWFDTWTRALGLHASDYMLLLCRLSTSLTAFLALSVVGVDLLFRNYNRLGLQAFFKAFHAKLEERHKPFLKKVVYGLVFLTPLGLIAVLVVHQVRSPALAAAALVTDTAEQVVAECGDARYVFTDGSLDAAVECLSRAKGGRLKALSLMSRHDPFAEKIRLRDETDPKVQAYLRTGAAEAMRTWVRERNPCVSNIAVQVGLELWLHDKLPVPKCGGLVARTAPAPQEVRAAAAAQAQELSDRILELREKHDLKTVLNPTLYSMVSYVQFRLSRMALVRAYEGHQDRDIVKAGLARQLSDRLDAANPEFKRIQELVRHFERESAMRLTPREGLKVGFYLRDLRYARVYAQQVLEFDPLDFRANYAVGMSALAENDLPRAKDHLTACLHVRPEDPVVCNNIAVVLLRMDCLDDAEHYALKSLKLQPDNASFRKTLDDIHFAQTNAPAASSHAKSE